MSLVQSMSDGELAEAVEELKRSTAAVEKQTEILRLQQNAMSSFAKNNTHAIKARSQMDANQIRRWDIEKGQIKQAVSKKVVALGRFCLLCERLRNSQKLYTFNVWTPNNKSYRQRQWSIRR